jgi:hypothetical protein
MMHHPLLSGDRFVATFAERDPPRAMNVLLERAFAPPGIYAGAQPDAIKVLATLDKPLATQAFVQAWSDQVRRRKYLARTACHLDKDALRAMIDHLEEDSQRGYGNFAYRAACVELRRAHERAKPLLLERFNTVDAETRVALSKQSDGCPGRPRCLPRSSQMKLTATSGARPTKPEGIGCVPKRR